MLNHHLITINIARIGLTVLLMGLIHIAASALDMRDFLETHAGKNQNEFLDAFPFQQFLTENGFGDFDSLNEFKHKIDKLGFSGDKFLYKLTQNFIETRPLDFKDFSSFVARYHLAEYINQKNNSQEMIYEMLANMLMENLSQTLNKGLKSNQISKHHPELQGLVQNLSQHQFIVNIPMSNFEKLQYHISEGNWAYILDRLIKEFFWGSYWLFGLTVGLLLITGIIYLKRITQYAYELFFSHHSNTNTKNFQ